MVCCVLFVGVRCWCFVCNVLCCVCVYVCYACVYLSVVCVIALACLFVFCVVCVCCVLVYIHLYIAFGVIFGDRWVIYIYIYIWGVRCVYVVLW